MKASVFTPKLFNKVAFTAETGIELGAEDVGWFSYGECQARLREDGVVEVWDKSSFHTMMILLVQDTSDFAAASNRLFHTYALRAKALPKEIDGVDAIEKFMGVLMLCMLRGFGVKDLTKALTDFNEVLERCEEVRTPLEAKLALERIKS